jgi:GH15 family glucan-1,4-alpha-glucosidase
VKLEHLGLIGNCQISALVEKTGSIVWSCLPRFDAEPMFSALLDEANGGRFVVEPAGGEIGSQEYLENTNILATTFRTKTGVFRVLDFAPRFLQGDAAFRPPQLHRLVEPLEGQPAIRVRSEPLLGWSKQPPRVVQGAHHIRYEGYSSPVWLATDLPSASTWC